MKSNLGNVQRLKHIYEACLDIAKATENVTKEEFINGFLVRAAVCNFITIIGEAVANLTEDFKAEHLEFDWKAVKGMRNIIVHEYFGIDYAQIWDAVEYDIPKLKFNIENILKDF